MSTQRRIDGDVQERIHELALLHHWNPTQIHRDMKADEKYGETRTPHVRTIRRVVSEAVLRGTGEDWWIGDSEGADAKVILAVWKTAIQDRPTFDLSKSLAEWILRIRRVAGDKLPSKGVLLLAQLYEARAQRPDHYTRDLDLFLAYTPWAEPAMHESYEGAVNEGRIVPAPLWEMILRP